MKNKFLAAVAMVLTLCGIGVINSTGAFAANVFQGCSIGGYSFQQWYTKNTSADGLRWEIPYLYQGYLDSSPSGPVGLEWRARVINNSTGIAAFDNLYNTNATINHASQSVGNFVKSTSWTVKLNVGRLGDSYPTCETNTTL